MNRHPDVNLHIDEMYNSLEFIRRNMTILSNRYNPSTSAFGSFEGSNMRDTLQCYTRLYTDTLRHIERLYQWSHARDRNTQRYTPPSENRSTNIAGNYLYLNGDYYPFSTTDTNRASSENVPPPIPPPIPPPTPRPERNAETTGRQRNRYAQPSTRFYRDSDNVRSPLTQPLGSGFSSRLFSEPLVNPLTNLFENATTEMLNNLTPVIVRPSQQQIERSTRRVLFCNIVNPINLQCPISLDTFTDASQVVQIIACSHIFTPYSFQRWFDRNVRCPVCRHDIRRSTQINESQGVEHDNTRVDSSDYMSENTSEVIPDLEQQALLGDIDNAPIQDVSNNPIDIEWQYQTTSYTDISSNRLNEPLTTDITEMQNIMTTYIQEQINSLGITDMVPPRYTNDTPHITNTPETQANDELQDAVQHLISSIMGPSNELINTTQQILSELITNNNYRNVNYDPSNNQITFETIIADFTIPSTINNTNSGEASDEPSDEPHVEGVD